MDVAAASIAMSQAQLKQNVGVSLAGQVKDQMSTQGEGLEKLLDAAQIDPNLGNSVDFKA
ncbi:putative motility protein [Halalkalibacillus sediminis]|uniref:Putative motility protein n=1 Tax=Halalkalibacillus sediminis TaxID=2018042 RepID=A0A2I0QTY2_9BACI|nr:YjfB family protein [Halalkalibacillus sediminis]PKR77769.1 putative motility protein [Halalkalibacillus sediminis]